MMDVAIVGCGKLGSKVAEALADGDYAVTLIDRNDDALERLAQQLDVMTINEDARKISVLEELNIDTFEFLLASTGNDEMNITIASFAKKLGCKHVIARVRDPEHMNQFDFIKEAMGIDSIVNPDMAITVEIYKYLVEKYALSNGMFTSGKIALTEFPAESYQSLIGLNMQDIREVMPDILICAISRAGKVILPEKDDEIKENDIIYALGDKNVIAQLHKKVHSEEESVRLNNVMIIGGGKAAYYLSNMLLNMGMSVKIIETNKNRCEELSLLLPKAIIINGDGTNEELLKEEGIATAQAFIPLTGIDEENTADAVRRE